MMIVFLESTYISEDGHTARRCDAGLPYDIADTAARNAIADGKAIESKHYDFHKPYQKSDLAQSLLNCLNTDFNAILCDGRE